MWTFGRRSHSAKSRFLRLGERSVRRGMTKPCNPVAICAICKGPINSGEPVVAYGDGLAHRFKTTCDYEKEHIKVQDAAFARELKIRID
jgi:hypothetical protein